MLDAARRAAPAPYFAGPRLAYAGTMDFRPLTAADLPLVAQWLTRPHVAEWWDGPIGLEPGLRQVQVLPPSSENACSKWHESGVTSEMTNRTRMARPLSVS